MQKEFITKLREEKRHYKDKMEKHFNWINNKTLWDTMKSAINMNYTRKPIYTTNEQADEMTNFYRCFDTQDSSRRCDSVLSDVFVSKADRLESDVDVVTKVFQHVCSRNATGPDCISAFLLKTFEEELEPAWCPIFQLSVDSHRVPILWKTSYITLVPNKTCPKENNDYRPVALTSIVMKCLERIMACKLRLDVQDYLDPFQYAYRQGRGTDDAVNTVVHLILKHLDKPKAYARLLFIDFSSAFNFIQPHTLLTKLKQMNVNPYIIKWYLSFLTDRVQLVKVNQTLSQTVVTNTGAPQGCVSSPILYILYTNDCTSSSSKNYIIKFSDDSAILSLLHADSDISMYTSDIESFVRWCDNNHLKLNISKITCLLLSMVKILQSVQIPRCPS